MRLLRVLIAAAFTAALFVLAVPAAADCPTSNPGCHLTPPQSRQINPSPLSSAGRSIDLDQSGSLLVTNFTSPLGLGAGSPVAAQPAFIDPVPLRSNAGAPDFPTLDVRQRYQDPSDVSCGVQALGMALDGLGSPGPASSALLDYLQGQGMMYDFGTGVEELAFAAQSFGHQNSLPFHGGSVALLQSELAAGRPVVVDLGNDAAEGLSASRSPGHFVTVTGISPDGDWIAYNDPILGKVVAPMDEFMRQWGLQGNSGVTVGPPAAGVSAASPSQPDPMNASPWLLFAAGVMALISNAGLGLRRQGIGGMIAEGGGGGGAKAAPKPAPKPASKPAASSSTKKSSKTSSSKSSSKSAPKPDPKPAAAQAPAPAPSLFSQISTAVSNAVTSVSSTVHNTISTAATAISNVASAASTAARNTVSSVATTVHNAAATVTTAVSTTVNQAAALVDDVAEEAREIGRTVATTVSQAATTVTTAIRIAATSAVSTVRTAAERVSNTARNVTAGALTVAHDAIEAATPVAQRIVAAPFIELHDVVARASEGAQAVIDGVGATVEALRVTNEDRNPRFAARMGLLEQIGDGLTHFGDNWGAIIGMANEVRRYTLESVLDGRWADAARGARGIGQMNTTLAQFGGQVGLSMLATPFTAAWEFGSATREHFIEGEGRELDVAVTGGDLILSLLGVYGAYSAARSVTATNSVRALQAAPEPGTPLFRVFGDEARGLGRSWTTVSPDDVPDFRAAAGLFEGNTGRFVAEGQLTDIDGVLLRSSLRGPTTPPGTQMVPELVVPKPASQITLTRVSGANPPF